MMSKLFKIACIAAVGGLIVMQDQGVAKPKPKVVVKKNVKAGTSPGKKDESGKDDAVVSNGPKPVSSPNNQVKQELHVYVDNQKNLYWPVGLPFWVRLSTSADEEAESFLLEKLEVTGINDANKIVKDGVRLEIPGSQFIRWVNHVSKSELKYRFYADGAQPEVSLSLANAPSFATKNKNFFGKGLTGAVVAKDEHSGVNSRYIAIDDKPFAPYDNVPAKFTEEKLYKVHYYAIDNVGYVSPIISSTFQVDLTPPKTVAKNQKNFKENILSRQTRIFLTSTDDLSGVRSIHYKIDGQTNFAQYDSSAGVSLEQVSDGNHVLNFYAVDNVDNRELPQKYLFYLDNTPPALAHTFIGDHHLAKGKHFVSSRTRVMIDANDSQVKVQETFYKVNDGQNLPYAAPFMPAVKSGEFALSYKTKDELGNAGEPQTIHLVMDNDPPQSSYDIKGPSSVKDKGVIYLTKNSKMTLHATDTLSGVKTIAYQINDQQAETYTTPISFPKDGRYLFRYWANDQVNNQEPVSTILLIVDNNAPEVVTIFSQDPVASKVTEKGVKVSTYPSNTALTLNAIDDSSGVEKIHYTVTGHQPADYTGPISFVKAGKYDLTLSVTDKVGNKATKSITFEISDAAWNRLSH